MLIVTFADERLVKRSDTFKIELPAESSDSHVLEVFWIPEVVAAVIVMSIGSRRRSPVSPFSAVASTERVNLSMFLPEV